MSRDELIPRVADSIVEDCHHFRNVSLGAILEMNDDMLDALEMDADDLATLATGSIEQLLDLQSRVKARALELTTAYLETDPRGAELIAEAQEREREDAAELAELNERAA